MLIVCFTIVSELIYSIDQIVHHSHDEIIVVAFFAVLKAYLGVVKIIILHFLHIIDFLHCRLQPFVYFRKFSQRVLSTQVRQNLLHQVLVQRMEVLCTQRLLQIQAGNVLQDVLRTEYFGLLKTHFSFGVVIES